MSHLTRSTHRAILSAAVVTAAAGTAGTWLTAGSAPGADTTVAFAATPSRIEAATAPVLSSVPETAEHRTSESVTATATAAAATAAAAEPIVPPGAVGAVAAVAAVTPESELSRLIQRMNSDLALLDEPSPEALATWHAGRSLESLAGVTYDAQLATNWLAARTLAPDAFSARFAVNDLVERLAESKASLEAERGWLYRELSRTVRRQSDVGSQSLHKLDDEAVARQFPTARDRYKLGWLLDKEAHSIGHSIAAREIEAQRAAYVPELLVQPRALANT